MNRPAEVRTSAELESFEGVEGATHRRWYVFEADYSGQILATVPVEMVPAWVNRRRLRRALRYAAGCSCWRDEAGFSVYVVEDLGFYPEHNDFDFDKNPELYHRAMEATYPWIVRSHTPLPLGLALAAIALDPFDEETKLAHWQFVGFVRGGMGGGRLLGNDAWLHYGLLYQGLPFINGLRRLLGLAPLSELNLEMNQGDRQHMELIAAVLG